MLNVYEIVILAILSVNSMMLVLIGIYNIYKDKISKEVMFRLQLKSVDNATIKDALPVTDLYKIVDDTIKFYTSRQLKMMNLSDRTEQELSLLISDIILTIASDVELHLSERFKQIWEIYFDAVPKTQGDAPSHLNLYIHDNTELILVRAIETMKRNAITEETKQSK